MGKRKRLLEGREGSSALFIVARTLWCKSHRLLSWSAKKERATRAGNEKTYNQSFEKSVFSPTEANKPSSNLRLFSIIR